MQRRPVRVPTDAQIGLFAIYPAPGGLPPIKGFSSLDEAKAKLAKVDGCDVSDLTIPED